MRGRKIEDLTGQRFGRLIVIRFVEKKKFGSCWLCKCDCGNEKIVYIANLKRKHTISCGCVRLEKITTHGYSKRNDTIREYFIWDGIKQRCLNERSDIYKNYGGRGIKVCNRWLGKEGFENFLEDMGFSPGSEYSIDRIDNDGDYAPKNCKWATTKEQSRNKRNNHWIEYKGMRKILHDWAIYIGIRPTRLSSHIEKGRSFEQSLIVILKYKENSLYTKAAIEDLLSR